MLKLAARSVALRGRSPIHLKLPHWSLLGGLLAANILILAGLLANSQIIDIWKKRSDTLAAYEVRIAQLNVSVDLLRLREVANRGNATLKLQELADLQMQVEEQLGTLQSLAMTAGDLGVAQLQSVGGKSVQTLAGSSEGEDQLDIIETELRTMEREILTAVEMISIAADRSTDTIVAELARIGQAVEEVDMGRGGPFVPVENVLVDSGLLGIRQAVAALDRLREARLAMDGVPIHQPVDSLRISSDFGGRKDPFTGQSAFHSGIDFPAPSGTPVRSAGRGVVIFVGWKGDYGNTVEISHASGLVSRYPHLSKALVQEGDWIEADMEIALVGSTGRSTGPHLHFELRDKNGAVDPAPYLAAGKRLQPFDT